MSLINTLLISENLYIFLTVVKENYLLGSLLIPTVNIKGQSMRMSPPTWQAKGALKFRLG